MTADEWQAKHAAIQEEILQLKDGANFLTEDEQSIINLLLSKSSSWAAASAALATAVLKNYEATPPQNVPAAPVGALQSAIQAAAVPTQTAPPASPPAPTQATDTQPSPPIQHAPIPTQLDKPAPGTSRPAPRGRGR